MAHQHSIYPKIIDALKTTESSRKMTGAECSFFMHIHYSNVEIDLITSYKMKTHSPFNRLRLIKVLLRFAFSIKHIQPGGILKSLQIV